jgi:hypothetical protein
MDGWIRTCFQEYNYLYFSTKHLCGNVIESQVAGMDRSGWWQHQTQTERTNHCKCDKFNIDSSLIMKGDLIRSCLIEWLWSVDIRRMVYDLLFELLRWRPFIIRHSNCFCERSNHQKRVLVFDCNRFVVSRDLPFNNHFTNSTPFRICHILFHESPSSTLMTIPSRSLWWPLCGDCWLFGFKECETVIVTCDWLAWVCKGYLQCYLVRNTELHQKWTTKNQKNY